MGQGSVLPVKDYLRSRLRTRVEKKKEHGEGLLCPTKVHPVGQGCSVASARVRNKAAKRGGLSRNVHGAKLEKLKLIEKIQNSLMNTQYYINMNKPVY